MNRAYLCFCDFIWPFSKPPGGVSLHRRARSGSSSSFLASYAPSAPRTPIARRGTAHQQAAVEKSDRVSARTEERRDAFLDGLQPFVPKKENRELIVRISESFVLNHGDISNSGLTVPEQLLEFLKRALIHCPERSLRQWAADFRVSKDALSEEKATAAGRPRLFTLEQEKFMVGKLIDENMRGHKVTIASMQQFWLDEYEIKISEAMVHIFFGENGISRHMATVRKSVVAASANNQAAQLVQTWLDMQAAGIYDFPLENMLQIHCTTSSMNYREYTYSASGRSVLACMLNTNINSSTVILADSNSVFVFLICYLFNLGSINAPSICEADKIPYTNNFMVMYGGGGAVFGAMGFSNNKQFNRNRVAELEAAQVADGVSRRAEIQKAREDLVYLDACLRERNLKPECMVYCGDDKNGDKWFHAESRKDILHYLKFVSPQLTMSRRSKGYVSLHDQGGQFAKDPIDGGKESVFEYFPQIAAFVKWSPDSHHAANTHDAHVHPGVKAKLRAENHSCDVKKSCHLIQLLNLQPKQKLKEWFITDLAWDLEKGNLVALETRANKNVAGSISRWAEWHRACLEVYREKYIVEPILPNVGGRKKILLEVWFRK